MKASRLGFLSVALVLGLSSCGILDDGNGNGTGDGPTISSFTADPAVVDAGGTSTLSWIVGSSATRIEISPDIGEVTGTSVETPPINTTTDFTLTATDASGNESTDTTTVTVEGTDTGGNGDGDGQAPEGTFGVSTSPDGTFTSDADGNITSNDDERIITISGGDTFYAQVAYADSDGIASIDLLLVNDEPAGLAGTLGATPVGGFTVGEPTGDCDLASTPQTVTCVYPITVAPGTPDIEDLEGAGNEFAYVFRVEVTDTSGQASGISDRGYVNIE